MTPGNYLKLLLCDFKDSRVLKKYKLSILAYSRAQISSII